MDNKDNNDAISIEDFKPICKGSLWAFFTVSLKGTRIHDCRIIKQAGQDWWISGPQREWTDGAGKRKFSPVVVFSDGLKERIALAIAGDVEALLRSHGAE